MNIYGIMLDEGVGVETDKKEAYRYIKMAYDKGNSSAKLIYLKMHIKDESEDDKTESQMLCSFIDVC